MPSQELTPANLLAKDIKTYLSPDGTLHEFDRHVWLDVARELGPEYCQSLYHAAVFTTKVAS